MAARKRPTVKSKSPIRSSEKSVVKDNKKSFARGIELKALIPAIIVVAIIGLLGLFRNQFVVATVNGKQISRIELIRELEKKDGKTVLESLISKELVMQEAEKRKVSVSDSEVKSQVSKIEKSVSDQGQNLELLLAQQNMTRADLTEQIKIQALLKKMVGDIKVTDKEVADYLEQNKDSIPEGTKPEEIKAQVKEQLEQQKLNEKIQTFVADLQKKAKIENLLPL